MKYNAFRPPPVKSGSNNSIEKRKKEEIQKLYNKYEEIIGREKNKEIKKMTLDEFKGFLLNNN